MEVPLRYKTEEGYSLGKWLTCQREAYRKDTLRHDRKLRLDALGMIWNRSRTNDWEDCYAYVKRFALENGHLRIPATYTVDGIWLNKWLNEQKQIYFGNRKGKLLTEEQIQKLSDVGVDFE